MVNEVTIHVTMADDTGAAKSAIKAGLTEWADSLPPIKVTATNPIDEAWQAEFDAGVKAAASEPVDVEFAADFEAFQATADEVFAALRAAAAEPLAIGPADMAEFEATALEAVASVRAEIEAAMTPIEMPPLYANATRLDQQAEQAALPAGANAVEIPLEAGNVAAFNADVLADVETLRAQVGSIVIPIEGARPEGVAAPESSTTNPWLAALTTPFQGFGGALSSMWQNMSANPWISALTTPFQGMFGGGTQQSTQPVGGAAPQQLPPDLAAGTQESLNQQPLRLDITASDPINDAFIGKLKSELKSISLDALNIPLDADTAAFAQQVEETIQELSQVTKADIPLEVADAINFREQVMQQVEEVSQSVKVVVQVDADTATLDDLRAKTLAAADASAQETVAQQKLNQALASGDEEQVTKARQDLAAASKDAEGASQELAAAQAAAAEEEEAVAAATDVASFSMRGLMAAMGPLWMIMNVVQIAMMAFGSSSSSTAQQTQDASQSIIQLGQSAGSATDNLVAGNKQLQGIAGDLTALGSSSTAFAQAYSGSFSQAAEYTNKFATQYQQLGSKPVHFDTASIKQLEDAIGEGATTIFTASTNIQQLTDTANRNHDGYLALTPALRQAVDEYNHLHDVVPQAQDALANMKAAEDQQRDTLASLGVVLSDTQNHYEEYGSAVQSAAKALSDAEAGSTYVENAVDKASIAAGQGMQQWQQLQQAVTSAHQAYQQAGVGVANAEHGIESAQQGVASAMHAEQQAVLATQQAQQAYTNSLYQEQQAQQAVVAARAAAQQQLISLRLQANDAASSVDSANLSLYQAQQNATKYDINSGNAQQIADTKDITYANFAQVQAAQQLVAAENALADAQNSSANASSSLNTARQQGVDGNPQVLAAEHSLAQAQDATAQAAQGVTNAQYAQQQAAQQVANAEWGLQQAHVAVAQAEAGQSNALAALNTAEQNLGLSTDGTTRSVDANTLAGAQNRQELANLYGALRDATGNTQIASQWTETYGEKMCFSKANIDNVLGSLKGLNGTNAKFSIEGTPSINAQVLRDDALKIGLDVNALFGGHAVGGPVGSGIALVGEQGPELVHLAPGSTVMPYANTQAALKGFASGGSVGSLDNPMSALAANIPMAAGWAAWDALAQTTHVLGGGPAPQLPAPGNNDLGPWAAAAAVGGGSMAASSAVAAMAQAYAQSQLARHGWGQEQMAPLVMLWNQESGWNPNAINPSSGAYGIPQSLGHGHPYNLGDFVAQVDWGEDYVAGRYGSPAAAWAHERAFNWYAGGGSAGGGLAVVGEHGPEIVSAGGALPSGGGVVQVALTVEFTGDTDSAMASTFMKLVRTNKIQLKANGARVQVGV